MSHKVRAELCYASHLSHCLNFKPHSKSSLAPRTVALVVIRLRYVGGRFHTTYSRVHISLDSLFSKILKKPSIVQKKMIPHMKAKVFSLEKNETIFFFFEKKNSKWPTQKKLIFQLRQFSIFFHENFMDWSLG